MTEQNSPINGSLRKSAISTRRTNALILALELAIRVLGFKRTIRMLERFKKPVQVPSVPEETILTDRYTTIFNRIKEHRSFRGRCLSQSLAMQFLLQRKGIMTELKIGVIMRSGAIDAHAWLEKDGRVLNDHPAVIAQYTILPLHSATSSFKFS